ncbi:MAG TPA: hypothetical protein VHQ47_09585 [Phycisphaerae bacterium]|nr:hypothetical protein [Phycisphaerae bacterium]
MPYRAMMVSVMTVVLALLAVGMWVRAIAPVVADVDAAAASEPHHLARPNDTDPAKHGETSAERAAKLHKVVPSTMLLSFLLICLLLLVGFAATFREWVRFSTRRRVASHERTPYVDAWKLAGERTKPSEPPDPDEEGFVDES